jgi:membrane-associated phospholipid phosphatase
VFGWHNAVSPTRQNPRIVFPLAAIAQMVLVIPVMTSITYIATSANFPLMDAKLLAWDRALGFEFRSYLSFINDRQWLIYVLAAGYRAISWPIPVIVVVLPLAGYYRRVGEFICAFVLALIATTCISTLLPATGVYGTLGLVATDFPNIDPQSYCDGLREIPALRDGSLRELDLFHLGGVLTFPSFHAASAILYAWAFWPVRWFRPLNLLCNGAMIAATPVGGGHYLVDVIAGVAVAILSIYGARRISRALATSEVVQANPAPQSGLAAKYVLSGAGRAHPPS